MIERLLLGCVSTYDRIKFDKSNWMLSQATCESYLCTLVMWLEICCRPVFPPTLKIFSSVGGGASACLGGSGLPLNGLGVVFLGSTNSRRGRSCLNLPQAQIWQVSAPFWTLSTVWRKDTQDFSEAKCSVETTGYLTYCVTHQVKVKVKVKVKLSLCFF